MKYSFGLFLLLILQVSILVGLNVTKTGADVLTADQTMVYPYAHDGLYGWPVKSVRVREFEDGGIWFSGQKSLGRRTYTEIWYGMLSVDILVFLGIPSLTYLVSRRFKILEQRT